MSRRQPTSKVEFLNNGDIQPCDWKDMLEEYMENKVDGKITPRQLIEYQKAIAKEISDGGVNLTILKIRNKFIGFGMYQKSLIDNDVLMIRELYVREGFRRYGYGTMLEKYIMEKARDEGYQKIIVASGDTVKFWQKRGYAECDYDICDDEQIALLKNLN